MTSGLENCSFQGNIAQITAKFSQEDFEDNTEDQILQDEGPLEAIPIDENFPGREIYRELKKDGSNFDAIMTEKFGEEAATQAKGILLENKVAIFEVNSE